ncbi:MAG: exonuclease SbcCD subunit D, partial [Candidatus Nanopelagicaceae bacterium]
MRILHSSDWHLGKKLDQYSLRAAHEQFLDSLIDDVLKDQKPDLLVVAGDIYDRHIAQTEN